MNNKFLSVFFTFILFSTLTFAVEVLKKSEELPCSDLGCTISPTAVSPKSESDAAVVVKKRETEVLKKSEELPCSDLGCTVSPTAVSPKSDAVVVVVKRGASDFVGDASYPVTEPPKDSVTPLGVEKESWLPRILGLGTR
uniref:Secreted protein n=1 Tax=Panagrolaimus sp. ES5 TaxID=591445 RepID=A0AC34F113_9BILA